MTAKSIGVGDGCLIRQVDEPCGHGLRLDPRVHVARGPHLGTEPFELAPVRCEALQHVRVASSGGVAEQVDRTPQDMASVVPIAIGKSEADPEGIDCWGSL